MPGTIDALAPLKDATNAALGDALIGYRAVDPLGAPLTGTAPSTVHGRLRGVELNAVEDFEADPTGVADSTAALQRLFDAAFGPASAPFGLTNPGKNRPAYIPPGTYKLTNSLTLLDGVGAYIYGAGRFATTLVQTVANKPIFLFNSFAYSRIESIRFQTTAAQDHLNAMVELYSDGTAQNVQSVTVSDCMFESDGLAAVGLRVAGNIFEGGTLPDNMGDGFSYVNCYWQGFTLAGLQSGSYNALSHTVIGGNFGQCTKYGIHIAAGSVSVFGTAFQAGYLPQIDAGGCDIFLERSGNDVSTFRGIRSESASLIRATTQHRIDVSGCYVNPGLLNLQTWTASHAYALGTLVNVSGNLMRVTTAGTSGAGAPSWNLAAPAAGSPTTTDGTATWTHLNYAIADFSVGEIRNSSLPYGYVNWAGQGPVAVENCTFSRSDFARPFGFGDSALNPALWRGNQVFQSGGINFGGSRASHSLFRDPGAGAALYPSISQMRLSGEPLIFHYGAGGVIASDVGFDRNDGTVAGGQTSISRNVLALIGTLGRLVKIGTNLVGDRLNLQGGLGTGNGGGGGVALRDQAPGASGAGVPDGADVLVARYNGVQLLQPVTLLNNHAVAHTAGTGSPEGVVTANPGSSYQRDDPVDAGTTFYTKVTGVGNVGWKSLAESAQGGIVLTRALPTVAGQEVDIGTFTLTQGAGNFTITVSVNSAGFSVAKKYETSIGFPAVNVGWQRLQPIEDSGPYAGQNFYLDINVLNNTVALRLYRAAGQGATAGTANVIIHLEGQPNDVFAPSSASGAAAAAAGYYTPLGGRVIPALTAGLAWPQTLINPRDLVPVDIVCPGALVGDLATVSLDSLITATLDANGLPITNSVLLTQPQVTAADQVTFNVWNIKGISQTVPAGMFRCAVFRVV